MKQDFSEFRHEVLNSLKETNKKLDKLCALLTAQLLLQETVSPEGEIRQPHECAEIISESFIAGCALDSELETKLKQYEYAKSEFFIDPNPELEGKKDDGKPPQMQFN